MRRRSGSVDVELVGEDADGDEVAVLEAFGDFGDGGGDLRAGVEGAGEIAHGHCGEEVVAGEAGARAGVA